MITKNLLPLLSEQVKKNTVDIANHYAVDRVLADFGIKVVGRVDTPAELPDASTFDGVYGDAYAVGVEKPYDYWIFTRPFEGETENQWFDIGGISIKGDQGPEGPQGPKGEQGESTRWYTGNGAPYGSGYDDGDMYLDTYSWNVYIFEDQAFKFLGNIKGGQGPQGPQGRQGVQGIPGEPGPQGANGTPGDAVRIVGVLSSASMLPEPASIARDTAYVVEDGTGQWLYFIVGIEPDLSWDKVAFENGTTVLVNDNPVQTFSADTKVDKRLDAPTSAYGVSPSNTDIMWEIYIPNTSTGAANKLAMYDDNACLWTPTPVADVNAANKAYVDNSVSALDTKFVENKDINNGGNSFTVANSVYGIGKTGENTLITFVPTAVANTLILRDTTGKAQVNLPTAENDIANKRFVQGIAITKLLHATASATSITLTTLMTQLQNSGYVPHGKLVFTALPSTASQAASNMGVGIQAGDEYCKYAKIEIVIGQMTNVVYGYHYDGTRTFLTVKPTSSIYRHSSVGMLIEVKPFQ
ncbi:MAG: collagen-like protein [Lachnospiraceae bacterium]|nr:collagen-like protein [Lachnospiraceae bacterium]